VQPTDTPHWRNVACYRSVAHEFADACGLWRTSVLERNAGRPTFTVWLEWIDCSHLPYLNLQVNPNVIRLHTNECAHFQTLYPILPSIEMFRCTSDLVPFMQLPPWNKLKQVGLKTPRAEPPMEDFHVGFFFLCYISH